MYWDHQTHKHRELKDKITEKGANHTNTLIDNIENKFRQMNENKKKHLEQCLRSNENKKKHLKQCLTDSIEHWMTLTDKIILEQKSETRRPIVYKIIDSRKLKHVEEIQRKKEKQQSQNTPYHSIDNEHQ